MSDNEQADFLSDAAKIDIARHFLAELHDELPQRIARYRYILDMNTSLGPGGTVLFGGQTTWTAYVEARSSFVAGNFIATIFLCQSLMENLLAASSGFRFFCRRPRIGR
jgi:hypothetical protein